MKRLIFIFAFLVGCDYHIDKADANGELIGKIDDKDLNFKLVMENVIAPKCLQCHGGGPLLSLNTYDEVVAHIDRIAAAVSDNRMPPRTPLLDDEKELLLRWIKLGAPL